MRLDREQKEELIGALVVAAVVLLYALFPWPVRADPQRAAEPPRAALKYRADLVRAVRLSWGLDGPVATMAAQVHQESAWRPDARSPYAHGLAQFTPDTAEWISGMDAALAGADTGNPVWSLRALARYNRWLYARVPDRRNDCAQWTQTLRAYNGGLGWIKKEAASGKPCEAFRSAANCRENLSYPKLILTRHEPIYAGWGRGLECWR